MLEPVARLRWGVGVDDAAAAVDAAEGGAVEGDDGDDGWVDAGEDVLAEKGNT